VFCRWGDKEVVREAKGLSSDSVDRRVGYACAINFLGIKDLGLGPRFVVPVEKPRLKSF
jgi:hypothetical protein